MDTVKFTSTEIAYIVYTLSELYLRHEDTLFNENLARVMRLLSARVPIEKENESSQEEVDNDSHTSTV